MPQLIHRALLGWCAALIALLAPATAWGQGEPPTWRELVSGADLIVRARVVEQGRWGARLDAERTFYGTAPTGPFTVVGFNDPAFPPSGIDNEAMRLGEVYWLFLTPFSGARLAMEAPSWDASEVGMPAGSTYMTPSTIAGDVPEREGSVRVNLMHGGYSHFGQPMSRSDWEDLLSAMILQFHEGQESTALLEKTRVCLDVPVSPAPERAYIETPDVACLGRLMLLGERRWDDRLLKWISGAPQALGAAAALANRSGDPKGDVLIRAAALDQGGMAAAPMVVDAAQRDDAHRARIVRVVAPLLPASRSERPPPAPATLAQIRSEDTRQNILRLLVSLRSPEGLPTLIAELPYLNPQLLQAAIEALEATESGSWVEGAFALLKQPDPSRVRAVLQAAARWRPTKARLALHQLLARPDLPADLQREALQALSVVGDASSVALIVARLEPRLQFVGEWGDDRVDMVSAELTALGLLSPVDAEPYAWTVARQYLGVPRAWAEPEQRRAWALERSALQRAALAVLPSGSTVSVRVMASKDGPFEARGDRVVLVDGKVERGNSSVLLTQVATAVGTDRSRVRLCGPDPTGRVRCIKSRGSHWIPHQQLATPVVNILGAMAGLGPHRVTPQRRDAVMWLAIAELEGLLTETSTDHFLADLWDPPFSGPVVGAGAPPVVPELPPLQARPVRHP